MPGDLSLRSKGGVSNFGLHFSSTKVECEKPYPLRANDGPHAEPGLLTPDLIIWYMKGAYIGNPSEGL